MNIPENLRYTKDHEWISLDGDTATVGISDYAQHAIGDLAFVEIDAPGKKLGKDDVFGTAETSKSVNDLYSPVAGTIIEINNELKDHPELVNSDPYGAGWMMKMTVDNVTDIESLMDNVAYAAHTDH